MSETSKAARRCGKTLWIIDEAGCVDWDALRAEWQRLSDLTHARLFFRDARPS